jgi:hypothetical protein
VTQSHQFPAAWIQSDTNRSQGGFSSSLQRVGEHGILVLCKLRRLCYTLPVANRFRLFLGSSAVEHSTVNRMVAGSNPARGATTSIFAIA